MPDTSTSGPTPGPASSGQTPVISQAHLADLLEHHPEGVVYFDTQFRLVYANPVARRISRILPEHILTQTHWELYPATVGTELEAVYRRVLTTRQPETVPDFLYAPFNTWYRVRAVPVAQGFAIYYRDVTEEHRLAEQKQASEDRLSFALAAANGVGTWDWDIVNDRVYSDPHFAKIYGVTPESAAHGTPIADFTRNIHPGDAGPAGEMITEVLKTGGDFFAEYRLLQADGSIRWVAARGRVLLAADGTPLRFPGVSVDITEQKQRDDLLRLSEERYRILTELSPQSQWTANPQGLVLYANRTFLDYIGHHFIPSTGEEYIQCFAPKDRERVVEVWTRSVITGKEYAIDARLIRASDGAERWWHLAALPVRNDAGEIQQWLGTGTDIHDARLATERLQQQYDEIDQRRREFEAIYSGSPIGMALYEPTELRLIHINERQAEIFGLPKAEALGKTFPELVPGVSASLPLIRRAAAGESVLDQNVTGSLLRHSGEERSWNLNYTPIFGEDGKVEAVASATIETTSQKRAETALIQAEKLAAVGRLAASIAHEINNPLEAVTNLIFLSRQHAVVPEVQQFLDLAEQELRRVSVIANQTLRFHKQSTRPTECCSADLFDSTLSLYEGRLRNADIRVERLFREDPAFFCFEGDIRQVLSNLIGNAIDALPRSGRLLLRSRESTNWKTGAPGITLTIADTGAGIPANALTRIFEAFYTTKGFNGTGLGLWISTDIIERHGGNLRVRSSQSPAHPGTVFTVFLPFGTPTKTIS